MSAPHRPAHFEDARIRLDKLVVGPWENNVFVLRDKGTGDAVLLDAAPAQEIREGKRILETRAVSGVSQWTELVENRYKVEHVSSIDRAMSLRIL